MDRVFSFKTDGAQILVEHCELSLLELRSAFDILQESINAGRFPFPAGHPELIVVRKPE